MQAEGEVQVAEWESQEVQVSMMPPDSFFDANELDTLKAEAMTETCRLLRLLIPGRDVKSPHSDDEEEIRLEQDREEEDADCRLRVLRVARRQLWRERIKQQKKQFQHIRQPLKESSLSAADVSMLTKMRAQLSDMDQEANALVEMIAERTAELESLQKEQEDVGEELKEWGRAVTSLEAMAEDQAKERQQGEEQPERSQPQQLHGKAQVQPQVRRISPVIQVQRPQPGTGPAEPLIRRMPAVITHVTTQAGTGMARAESLPSLNKAAAQSSPVKAPAKSPSWLPSTGASPAISGLASPGGFCSPGGSLHMPAGRSIPGAGSPGGFGSPAGSLQAPARILPGIASPGGFVHSPGASLQVPVQRSPGGSVQVSAKQPGVVARAPSPGGSLQVTAAPSPGGSLQVTAATRAQSPGGSLQVPAAPSPGGSLQVTAAVRAQSPGGSLQVLAAPSPGGSLQVTTAARAQSPGGSLQVTAAPSPGGSLQVTAASVRIHTVPPSADPKQAVASSSARSSSPEPPLVRAPALTPTAPLVLAEPAATPAAWGAALSPPATGRVANPTSPVLTARHASGYPAAGVVQGFVRAPAAIPQVAAVPIGAHQAGSPRVVFQGRVMSPLHQRVGQMPTT
eukprot:TRINITY_DN12995_c0_g1_i1.p1 TRINITY_DN12995_c0_g1~~TRINITY_DN12995_c0_g1_i1.p1  ORF type:complete len:624 (+),score=121.68 TRINITY_DN12995_c0_g1_i1:49-1920(+)